MRQYTYEESKREGWRSYPIRLVGTLKSQCHKVPTILVQSMDGGYVTANCSECNKPDTLSLVEFQQLPVWMSCPECGRRMSPDKVPGTGHGLNYGYRCADCQLYIWLSQVLPRWQDVRPDHA